MVRVAKPPKPPEPIRHDESVPGPAQAAQIALLVMKKVGCQTWKDVVEKASNTDLRTKVILSPEQQALIDEYADIIPYLSTSPLVTVVACPLCGRYGLQDRRSAGSRCIFTMRCPGKPVKGSSTPKAQTRTKAEPPDDSSGDVPDPAEADVAEAAPPAGADGLYD
ncbi:hypothetical protein [Microbacterium gorillae]|uniref:hypothetical protein n=1 Tax=Microbacterium gorillae TaxID=1231063 RepID=UPI003D974FE0